MKSVVLFAIGIFIASALYSQAPEKNLKLIRIIRYDSSVTVTNGRSPSVFIPVPQDRYWKVENLYFNAFNGSTGGRLYINGKNIWSVGTGVQIFTGGPIWCVPGDVLDLFGVCSSAPCGGTFDYRLAIFEFALE
jgi:hypothetical protein